jgi:undecaprenyl-diphosphatase
MNHIIFQLINNLAGKCLTLDFFGIFLAEYLPYILILSTLIILFKNKKAIVFAFSASVLARIFTELIRWLCPSPRPFVENEVNQLISHEATNSFPSGHTSFFFALSYVVYKYNKKAGLWFFAGSALISVSRVFVGIHWPYDILFGAVLGIVCGWLILTVAKKFL